MIIGIIDNIHMFKQIENDIESNKLNNVLIVGKSDHCHFCNRYNEILKNIDYPVFLIDIKHKNLLSNYEDLDIQGTPFTIFHKNNYSKYWLERGMITEEKIHDILNKI